MISLVRRPQPASHDLAMTLHNDIFSFPFVCCLLRSPGVLAYLDICTTSCHAACILFLCPNACGIGWISKKNGVEIAVRQGLKHASPGPISLQERHSHVGVVKLTAFQSIPRSQRCSRPSPDVTNRTFHVSLRPPVQAPEMLLSLIFESLGLHEVRPSYIKLRSLLR